DGTWTGEAYDAYLTRFDRQLLHWSNAGDGLREGARRDDLGRVMELGQTRSATTLIPGSPGEARATAEAWKAHGVAAARVRDQLATLDATAPGRARPTTRT
ncbi:hypothetical protein CTI14_51875, partial [Methylobacterium radiotolerans]